MSRDVDVKIERLALHGFPPAARERIAAAFAAELQRLYADASAPETSFAAPRVNAGVIQAGAPETVGMQAARQTFARLSAAGGSSPGSRGGKS
jgi:hypothetical protein